MRFLALAKRFKQNPGNTAICYYRYSSEAQRDASIEQQREAAHDYADKKGYRIVKEYQDRAMSGSRDDRPDFQLMLAEVKRLRPSYLILWKTDRLSRDKLDSNIAKALLRNAGVKIVYVAEYLPEEDEGLSVFMEAVYEGMAQQFLIAHSKNVTRGLHYNAEHCLYNGHVTFGYIGKPNCRYEIDEVKAPIVKKIFNDYADGIPMKQIVDELDAAGIKSVRNRKMTINSLDHILTNRAYIGEYHYGEYVTPNGMPRIISDELFDKVQEMRTKNKRGGKRKEFATTVEEINGIEDYWLVSKVYCGYCDAPMHGLSGTSKQGKLHYYYTCNNHRKRTSNCSKKNIKKDTLEAYVVFFLSELFKDSSVRIMIAQKCFEYHKNNSENYEEYAESIKASIADVDKRLNNIMKAIEDGIYNETTKQRMEDLENQKEMLNNELLTIETRKKNQIQLSDILKYIDTIAFDMKSAESRQIVLDYLVDKIYVFDDKIVITLFYTEDKRTLEFSYLDEVISNRKLIDELLDGENFYEMDLESPEIADTMLKSMLGDNQDFFA